MDELKASLEASRSSKNYYLTAWYESLWSMWVRGDNIVENAKKPEYGNALDAKELYPDLKLHRLMDYAKEVYDRL